MKTPDELRSAIEAEGGPNYEEGKRQAEKIIAKMEKSGMYCFISINYCGVEARRILSRLGYDVTIHYVTQAVTIDFPKAAKPPQDSPRKPWWRFWA